MATIESRLLVLERTAANSRPVIPLPFCMLPPEGDLRRVGIQAKIAEREKTGQRFITYEIVR